MLSIENYNLHMKGKPLLTDLVIAHKHRYALVGKNGTGTLLQDIERQLKTLTLMSISCLKTL